MAKIHIRMTSGWEWNERYCPRHPWPIDQRQWCWSSYWSFHSKVERHYQRRMRSHHPHGTIGFHVHGLLRQGAPWCEVVVGTTSNCLPTSVPILPILLRAILYSLQYLYSFPPIVRLFYLTRCLHPYLLLSSIQPGVLFTYDYPNPPHYMIKLFAVNSIT